VYRIDVILQVTAEDVDMIAVGPDPGIKMVRISSLAISVVVGITVLLRVMILNVDMIVVGLIM